MARVASNRATRLIVPPLLVRSGSGREGVILYLVPVPRKFPGDFEAKTTEKKNAILLYEGTLSLSRKT